MAETTWTQSAGMASDEDTDNLESYVEQAEASKDAAAVSAVAAEAAKVTAAASEAAALASKNSAATSATTATTGAATATAKASEAAASAASASTSATGAQTARTAAEAAETAAAASETASAASAAAATTSETNAATSASAASTSATNAGTSETNAATSASAAATSETNAAASETAASASETNAAASETAAATSESNAASSASAASTSASNAATSESNAASSASAAYTSETNAATSASNASTSETNAATSASNAATSASEAAASAASINPDSIDINGGTIDGTVIGGATPAAGSFTTGQFGTSLNVDGTVTADGLTVQAAQSSFVEASGGRTIAIVPPISGYDGFIRTVGTSSGITIQSNTTHNVLKAAGNGDISFYEDTGTTPKFFWDASAESLGIGTSSPARTLSVNGVAGFGNGTIETVISFSDRGIIGTQSNHALELRTNGSERLRIDSSGNVGIGTSSPSQPLHVSGNIRVGTTSDTVFSNNFGSISSSADLAFLSNSNTVFKNTSGTERMRITSTGSVGIGTSSPASPLTVKSNASAIGMGLLCRGSNDFGFLQFKSTDDVETIAEISVNRTAANTGSLRFSTNNGGSSTERMRITSTGNVGIGTSAPDEKLEVYQGNIKLGTDSNTTSKLIFERAAGDRAEIYVGSSYQLQFDVGGSERMRIDSSGSLLVGTTVAASNKMHLAFDNSSQNGMRFSHASGTYTNPAIVFVNAVGTTVGSIKSTGTATTYNTSSDYRLKTDIQGIDNPADRLMSLKPCNFEWKADGTRTDGFIAHEAQAVVPEAVTGTKDGDEMQAIDQSKLVPLLTAALQEALTEIDALETRITALEG